MGRNDLVILGIIAAAVGLYFLFYQKSGANQPVSDFLMPFYNAGAWVGQNVITPVVMPATYQQTAARGMLEGYAPPSVPETPSGYRPSNWTWTLKDGTSLGLPAGMTPQEFCKSSPTSPICKQIMAGV